MERFFLNPWALAFSALAGGIVLLYILKLKRAKVRVSSTLLWERSVHDFKANAPWQKLRRNLLMLLQILALILLAIALARPFIFGTALTGGRNVIVIDTSASMLTTDEKPDRLGSALNAAKQMVADMSRSDEGMILAAGPAPIILSSFTSNKAELLSALDRARDTAGGLADLNSALRLVTSVTAGSDARVVVFSDGALPDIDPLAISDAQGNAGLNLSFFPIGSETSNLGIVGAGARRNPFNDEYELFVAVRNYYPMPIDSDVSLSVEGELIDVREVSIRAGQRTELVLASMPYIPEPIKVELDFEDSFAEDNVAYISMPQQEKYKVALCTDGESLLLHRMLQSLDFIDLYIHDGSGSAPAGAERIDVWVVEGDAASAYDPTASYLFINVSSHPFLPVKPGARAELDFGADPPVIPTVVGIDSASELLRFVNIGDLNIQAMRKSQLEPWGKIVVDASEGPLIVEGRLEGQRTLYLSFDLYETDLALRAAFPIFMANLLRALGRSSGSSTGLSARSGDRVDLVAPLDTYQVDITKPNGSHTTINLGGREFTVADTTDTGVYDLRYLDESGTEIGALQLPVCLVSDFESNIAPAQTLQIRGSGELAGNDSGSEIIGARQVRINREFYTWLILGVLFIIGVEWYLFHTRAL